MRFSIIVAMDLNRTIGKDGDLPWYIPSDLKRFKKITMGKPIVMGRKTHESIGRALPGRKNIILTRKNNYTANDCTVLNSKKEIISHVENTDEIMIIGGAEIYKLFLDEVSRIYLTKINAKTEGNTFFPFFLLDDWDTTLNEPHMTDEKNNYNYNFIVLDRKNTPKMK